MKPAIQLYTVRAIEEPLSAIIERIADAGFEGVEFANRIRDADLEAVADALDRAGIEPVGIHIGMDDLTALERDPGPILAQFGTIGCRRLVLNHPPISHFRTEDRVLALADRINDVGNELNARGFELHYHNADHDFLPLGSRTPLSRFLIQDVSQHSLTHLSIEKRARSILDRVTTVSEYVDDRIFEGIERVRGRKPAPLIGGTAFGRLVTSTDPSAVSFELDIGNVVAAGYDPAEVLERLDGRVSQVHIKDVAIDQSIPGTGNHSVDPGTGDVNIKAAINAARQAGVDWLIYEHDDPSDPVSTIQDGLHLLRPRQPGGAHTS